MSSVAASRPVTGGYYDEIEVGDTYVSPGRTITESDIVSFGTLTGDLYPLHMDAEWAAGQMFGERIAHGMLVVSYAMGLIVPRVPGPIVAFYGIDKLRFVGPTKIGDTIHVEVELVEKEDKGDDLGVATFSLEIKNQRDEPVVKLTNKVLLRRKE